jgi:type II secretory pathway component GspD/PulD (secretin)
MDRTVFIAASLAIRVASAAVAVASLQAQPPARPPDMPVVRLEDGAQTGYPTLPVTRLDDRRLDTARPLSLTFSQPLPVRDVLLMLFRGTPVSVVFDPGVNGTFIGELKDLTLREALEAVLSPIGLDYTVDGTVVAVFPRRSETRLYTIDHLSSPRTAALFTELAAGVQALLSQTGRSHVDRATGIVHVTDFADRLDQVAVYLETFQLRAARQVRIAVKLCEGEQTIASAQVLAMNNEPAVVKFGDAASDGMTLTVTAQISPDGMIQVSVAPASGALATDTMVRVKDGETAVVSRLADTRRELSVHITPTVVAGTAAATGER